MTDKPRFALKADSLHMHPKDLCSRHTLLTCTQRFTLEADSLHVQAKIHTRDILYIRARKDSHSKHTPCTSTQRFTLKTDSSHLNDFESVFLEVVRLSPRDVGGGNDGIGEDVASDVCLLKSVDDERVGATNARRKDDVQCDVAFDEPVQSDRF